MSIGHRRLHERFSYKAIQVSILVWIPGAQHSPPPYEAMGGKKLLVRRALIKVLKVKEVLTSSLLQPPQPLAASKPHCPPK